MLARHKNWPNLGHKILKSVTIFAADSVRTYHKPTGRPDMSTTETTLLVNWPVLIWELGSPEEAFLTQARNLQKEYLDAKGDRKLGPDGKLRLPKIPCAQIAPQPAKHIPRVYLPDEELRVHRMTPGNVVIR
jgi:hypothetical protein